MLSLSNGDRRERCGNRREGIGGHLVVKRGEKLGGTILCNQTS